MSDILRSQQQTSIKVALTKSQQPPPPGEGQYHGQVGADAGVPA